MYCIDLRLLWWSVDVDDDDPSSLMRPTVVYPHVTTQSEVRAATVAHQTDDSPKLNIVYAFMQNIALCCCTVNTLFLSVVCTWYQQMHSFIITFLLTADSGNSFSALTLMMVGRQKGYRALEMSFFAFSGPSIIIWRNSGKFLPYLVS